MKNKADKHIVDSHVPMYMLVKYKAINYIHKACQLRQLPRCKTYGLYSPFH